MRRTMMVKLGLEFVARGSGQSLAAFWGHDNHDDHDGHDDPNDNDDHEDHEDHDDTHNPHASTHEVGPDFAGRGISDVL